MTQLAKLESAIFAERHKGRIATIRKVFAEYKESLQVSRWQKIMAVFSGKPKMTVSEQMESDPTLLKVGGNK